MKEKKQNEELQSRREFFKEAAKKALPVIGAIALASSPIIAQAAEKTEPMGCSYSGCQQYCVSACYNGCNAWCGRGCKNWCAEQCQGNAKNNYCNGCNNHCQVNCGGGCQGSCNNGSYKGC